MNETSLVTAWLASLGSNQAIAERDITAALKRAGVLIDKSEPNSSVSPGILLCNDACTQVCDFVRACTRHGLGRLLAVIPAEAMTGATAWKLLAAGASDVLSWQTGQEPACMIADRLRRWQMVDELVESPRVREVLVGQSPVWICLLRQVVEVARFTDAPILLVGETGTGKELLAHLVHSLSPQRNRRELVILDCTTIVSELSGSELFGHERGAFTGAVAPRDGAFALANEGTLFLDEVGELPLSLQPQLLRVIQEHTYKRVGSNTWHKTDFRLVCASNRDLGDEEVRSRFRRDLYYRIASWVFRLPSLDERREDILPLTQHFIQQMRSDDEPAEIDEPVQRYLLTRPYPGNVRDLRNLIQRIVHRHVGQGPITIGDIPADERPSTHVPDDMWHGSHLEQAARQAVQCGAGLREIRHAAEDAAISAAYECEGKNWSKAAKRLGVTERALQMRRKEQQNALAQLEE